MAGPGPADESSSEGCQYLKAYLEKRMALGIERDSPIIAVKQGYEEAGFRESRHVTTKTISKEIRGHQHIA